MWTLKMWIMTIRINNTHCRIIRILDFFAFVVPRHPDPGVPHDCVVEGVGGGKVFHNFDARVQRCCLDLSSLGI